MLSYAKQIADNHAGAKVKDCVITIPPFFAHAERQAMINAAAIAGLNVLALVHENTAFAFKYGFDKEKEFADQPLNVVFYDLGATSYKVSLVNFFSTVGKKNKTTGGLTVKGVAWDSMLGGRDFDHVVLDILADEFNKQGKNGYDVRAYPRAVGKLRKEAERVKDVLSANTAYQVGIESVHEDRDLRMVIKREDFEARAEAKGLWARLAPPLDEVLRQANLTKESPPRRDRRRRDAIPRVKELAKSYFGRTDGSLNGDEAAALGATLYAAKLSTSFRLRVRDHRRVPARDQRAARQGLGRRRRGGRRVGRRRRRREEEGQGSLQSKHQVPAQEAHHDEPDRGFAGRALVRRRRQPDRDVQHLGRRLRARPPGEGREAHGDRQAESCDHVRADGERAA